MKRTRKASPREQRSRSSLGIKAGVRAGAKIGMERGEAERTQIRLEKRVG